MARLVERVIRGIHRLFLVSQTSVLFVHSYPTMPDIDDVLGRQT